jgi:hypothetical protein
MDLGDFACGGAGDRRGRFIGLKLNDVLVVGDGVAFLHEDVEDVGGVDAIAEGGENDFHLSLP